MKLKIFVEVCTKIEDYADPWAKKYIIPALKGDVEAAFSLGAALSNEKRGSVVVDFWAARAPRAAFRELLGVVWEMDHQHLIRAAETRRRLRSIFRYARFDTSMFAETVQVWRGAAGCTVAQAARGFSWSTNRDTAYWFASHSAHRGRPVVVTANILRTSIVYFSNGREESEIVTFDPVDYSIDEMYGRMEITN